MKGFFITLILSYGGGFVALFEPFVGLLAYITLANLRPEYLWFWAVPRGGNYSRVVAAGLLVGFVMQEFLRWRQREPSAGFLTSLVSFALRPVLALAGILSGANVGDLGRARAVIACLVGFFLWAVFSATLANNPVVAWNFIDILSKIVLPVVLGICLVTTTARLKALAWTLVLSQGYIAYEMNLVYYQGYNQFMAEGFGGMDNNSASIGMVTGMGLAFFLGLYSPRWWQQLLAFGCAALMGHSVLFAMSRGGMVAMVLTGAAAFALIRKTWRHYAVLTLAILLGLRLAGEEVRERFFTTFAGSRDRDASAESRLHLWRACVDVVDKNPFFGVGPDHWPLVANRYGFSRGKEAHTLWLQVAAETGLPGVALLIGFYGLCLTRLWPLARGRLPAGADPWLSYLASAVIAGLVGFAVSAQFVSLKLLEIPYYVTLVGAGVLKLASTPREDAAPALSRDLLPVPGTL